MPLGLVFGRFAREMAVPIGAEALACYNGAGIGRGLTNGLLFRDKAPYLAP